MIVKSVGVLSVGKMFGSLYALMGLLVGGIISLIALAGAGVGGQGPGPAGILFGAGAIIAVPVFYGVLGFVGGIISAALYNFLASVIGGIEIELSRDRGEYVD